MGNPRFKFTLSHSVVGTRVISEPDGWKDCIIKLERDKNFHSLVEYFDGGAMGGFIFYGSNGIKDGGRDFIWNIDKTYGYNAKITLTVQISFDDGLSYADVFTGVLDLGGLKEMPDNKLMVPVIPDSTWTTFINRMGTPVNLGSTTTLDGAACAAATSSVINLPSQSIRAKFLRNTNYNDANASLFSAGYGTMSTAYLIFDNSYHDLDELDERFEYGSQVSGEDPTTVSKYFLKAKYAGTYRVQALIYYTVLFNSSVDVTSLQFFLKYKNPGDATTTDFPIGSPDAGVAVTSISTGIFAGNTVDETITLQAGGEIYLYGVLQLSASRDIIYLPDYDSDSGAGFAPVYTELEVTGDTTFPDTTAECYTVHEALKSCLTHMGLGDNPLLSNHFTVASGCAGKFVLVKGLQLRGYTLSEKPFFISFKDLWDGLNPIFNLGLGMERSGLTDIIRIEQKAHFYDKDSAASYPFPDVRYTREYDESRIVKKVDAGYSQWKSENISGIDDPQTKHTYSTVANPTGEDLTILSGLIAASLAIETVRRAFREKKSQDHKFDDSTFIINVTGTSSPFTAETGETFTTTTNLLNESTRYNRILTPKRNLLRWANYVAIGLQKNLSSPIKFVSGEGNFDMTTDLDCGDGRACLGIICDSIAENADVNMSVYGPGIGFLHLADSVEYETKLAWEDYFTIRNNRKKSISFSQGSTNFKKLLIDKLEYKLSRAQVSVKAWKAENVDMIVPESTQPSYPVCEPGPEDAAPPSEFDADYQAVLDYAALQGYDRPSYDQQVLQNDLVLELKSIGVWDDLDVLYVFATDGDRDFAKINWKDPGSFTCTEVNTPTFTENEGFQGNGSSSYLNTGWVPNSDAVNYTLNEAGWFTYVTNEIAASSSKSAFGARNNDLSGQLGLLPKSGANLHAASVNSLNLTAGSSVSSIGFFQGRRVASNDLRLFKNGSQVGSTSTNVSTGLTSEEVYVSASSNPGGTILYADTEISILGIGASLTGKESDLYNAWNTYFNAL